MAADFFGLNRRNSPGPNRTHLGRVRIVIIWNHRRAATPCKVLVTNRTNWEVNRILEVYRDRWTGTETFHRDGKQELGMGDCQLRDGEGQTRHMYLVMLAYSLLVRELKHERARAWASRRLKTIGEACHAMIHESLRATLNWVMDQSAKQGKRPEKVFKLLGLT